MATKHIYTFVELHSAVSKYVTSTGPDYHISHFRVSNEAKSKYLTNDAGRANKHFGNARHHNTIITNLIDAQRDYLRSNARNTRKSAPTRAFRPIIEAIYPICLAWLTAYDEKLRPRVTSTNCTGRVTHLGRTNGIGRVVGARRRERPL